MKWLPQLQEGVEKRGELTNASEMENLDLVQELLEYRAAKAAMEGALEIQLAMIDKNPYDAFNSSMPFANNKAALFYGELFIFNKCRESISKCSSIKNAEFVSKILNIYGLYLVKETSEFFLDYLSVGNVARIEETLLKLYN